MQNAAKKIALITGANKGIGFEVARLLGKAGCTVLLGARSAERGREAASRLQAEELDVLFIELDLLRAETAWHAAANVARDFERLDILVNNAGITAPGDGPPSAASLDDVRRILETNFLGTLAVTQAML